MNEKYKIIWEDQFGSTYEQEAPNKELANALFNEIMNSDEYDIVSFGPA